MKQYMFERKPNGEIGARYFFDTPEVPAQDVPGGSTMLTIRVRGNETKEELAALNAAKNRPQDYEVVNGTIKRKEGRRER